MELSLNNFPSRALHLYTGGFALLQKKSSETVCCENHQNASLPTLNRECGIFFGTFSPAEPLTAFIHSTAPILVPAEIQSQATTDFVRSQFDLSANETILEENFGPYVAFYPYSLTKLAQVQKAVGCAVEFRHIDLAIARFLQSHKTESPCTLGLWFEGENCDFILFKDSELQIINCFSFITKEDVLYYLLNILQQFDIPFSDCSILFAGPNADEINVKFFQKYLSHFQSIIDIIIP